MKKLLSTMAMLFLLTLSTHAMSYEQARQQALFLTDKMAYELNLSDEQYEAAYEINFDYLTSINTVDDLSGSYWRWRNLDMSYILLDWQYRAFCNAAYFYRPLYWDAGCWHFAIYARYPHRDYFYFGRPTFYEVYRGAHAWRHNNGRSWYYGRDFGGPGPRGGMRDGFGRGDFGHGYKFRDGHMVAGKQDDRPNFGNQDQRRYNGSRPFGGTQGHRESSTRTTVKRPNFNGSQQRPRGTKMDRNNQYQPSNGAQRPSSGTRPSFGGSRSAQRQPRPTFSSPSGTSRPDRGGAPRGGGNSGGARGSFGGHR